MAFGLLSSIIPQVDKNIVLYNCPPNLLTYGKISISNKNYNPAKIRLGVFLLPNSTNVDYFEYDRYINYGETFESELLYIGPNQRLVVRSTDPNVNFLFYGETVDESSNPVNSGVLNSIITTNSTKKLLYTVPTEAKSNLTLNICNLDSHPVKARIGLLQSNDISLFDSSRYLEYDVEIGPNQTYTRTEIKLDQNQSIICSSSENSRLNFICHGRINYGVSSGGEDDLNVSGNATIGGNLGVGTVFPRTKLDVIGNSLISGTLGVGGTIFGNINPSNLNSSLSSLGSLPAIDGSSLTGVIASGTGVVISSNDVVLGTASSINLGKNLTATFSGGISTITTSSAVDITGNFTVNTNKFLVSGATGNSSILGTLSIGSTLSVSSNINTLNNKVINLSDPSLGSDATNKRYVDTRSIAMSIALS